MIKKLLKELDDLELENERMLERLDKLKLEQIKLLEGLNRLKQLQETIKNRSDKNVNN